MKKLLFFIVGLLLLGCAYMYVSNNKKVYVVDTIVLFNAFKMKADLEKSYEPKLMALKMQCDSIKALISHQQGSGNGVVHPDLLKNYEHSLQVFEYEFNDCNDKVNTQVWKRLNTIIEAYGKAKKAKVIIGGNGMGTVLYSDEDVNITKEVIEYANKKYEGR
jgi:outer membrane protein